ncbi:uncharacterized protein C9orf43 homolog isoform X3 [Alexandromys fortis]|uniref:uncharacterized protein C9orf43 homolog isoform X3 n=1 Tax=Alexandromys fortis TaxID=100897 RepID=UPI002152124A|nr:uncharacterized protein C9orf43 homolog isoform X3 [Microtus fortis]
MRLRGTVWTGLVLKGREAPESMNLPNEDLWDETNCSSAVCQHPQCWASLRRIERGHPRILDSPGKSSREIDDKLPTLTIVNITDSCLWTKKRMAQRQSPKFIFPKEWERSLLLKPASRRYSRSQKAFYDKGVASCSRPPKLSVLNLNEAKLPFSEDVRNMVVTWVPEEVEKSVSSVGKTSAFSRWLEKKRKKLGEKSKPSLYFSGRQYTSTHSRSLGVTVPPPSPVHLFDQLSSKAIPLLTQVDMLPRDLLKECILAHEKTMACPEVKTELAKMKKNLPLERTRPDSALSSKMYLTVHRLTLQRPSLRYPEHLRKLQYNLKRDEGSSGYKKQQKQQQRKVKTSTEMQEAKKTVKSDVEREPSPRIPSRQESEQKQKEQEEEGKKVSVKHVSIDNSVTYDLDTYYTDYYTSPESPVIFESDYKDMSDVDETMLGMLPSSQDSSPRSMSGSVDRTGWNPDLKLLRILQASVEEDEENHLSRAQSEASQDA